MIKNYNNYTFQDGEHLQGKTLPESQQLSFEEV